MSCATWAAALKSMHMKLFLGKAKRQHPDPPPCRYSTGRLLQQSVMVSHLGSRAVHTLWWTQG